MSPENVAMPDVGAPEEHPMALAIREKPKPRQMNLPVRTMAQTSGIAKKGPGKDAPSRPVLAERIEHSLAVAYLGDYLGDDSNVVISEANPRLALDSPPRGTIVGPYLSHRRMVEARRSLAESPSEERPATRALRIDTENATMRSIAQGKEVSLDRNSVLSQQIYTVIPRGPAAASSATVTDNEWGQYPCSGCRQLIAGGRYACHWRGERFNLCEACFRKPYIPYKRHQAAGSRIVGEMDEGE